MDSTYKIDSDLFDLYHRQIRNALYDIECSKTLKDAQVAAKKADNAAILLRQMGKIQTEVSKG